MKRIACDVTYILLLFVDMADLEPDILLGQGE